MRHLQRDRHAFSLDRKLMWPEWYPSGVWRCRMKELGIRPAPVLVERWHVPLSWRVCRAVESLARRARIALATK